MVKKVTKTGKVYNKLEATPENWKPVYTKILAFVQKRLPDDKIGELVGLSVHTVKRIRTSPYFQERLDKALAAYEKKRSTILAERQATDSTMTKLEKAAEKAANIVIKALKGDSSITKTQIAVAKDILDRSGYKAVERQEVTHKNYNYTPEEIESARTTMFEMLETIAGTPSTDDYVISSPGSRLIKTQDTRTSKNTDIETIQDLQEEVQDYDD